MKNGKLLLLGISLAYTQFVFSQTVENIGKLLEYQSTQISLKKVKSVTCYKTDSNSDSAMQIFYSESYDTAGRVLEKMILFNDKGDCLEREIYTYRFDALANTIITEVKYSAYFYSKSSIGIPISFCEFYSNDKINKLEYLHKGMHKRIEFSYNYLDLFQIISEFNNETFVSKYYFQYEFW